MSLLTNIDWASSYWLDVYERLVLGDEASFYLEEDNTDDLWGDVMDLWGDALDDLIAESNDTSEPEKHTCSWNGDWDEEETIVGQDEELEEEVEIEEAGEENDNTKESEEENEEEREEEMEEETEDDKLEMWMSYEG